MGLFGSKKTMSRKEYNEWLEGWQNENERLETKVKPHFEKYGDNRIKSVDIDATLGRLIDEHFFTFANGAEFPKRYLDFYNAHKRQGYEIARFGSKMLSRAEMIVDYKLSNDHYSESRQISLQGLDILAQCQAYDAFLEYKRKEEDSRIYDHRKDYADAKKKYRNSEPIEVYCNNADTKKASKQLVIAELNQKMPIADEPDLIDNIGKGFKKLFGFK